MVKDIKKVLSKKGFLIYYHDSGSWVIYSSPKDINTETGDEHKRPVIEGDDFNGNGYAPELVEAMAELLGGKVFSI
jgi:hypothetical protein